MVALPEERKALVRCFRSVKRHTDGAVTFYSGEMAGYAVSLAEGGMGAEAATRASAMLIKRYKPEIMISAGFCGAVRPGAGVADLVLCSRLLQQEGGLLQETELPPGTTSTIAACTAILHQHDIKAWQGSFITSSSVINKTAFAEQLPQDMPVPVLEMESAAVANAAARAGIPFLGIRSVSDGAEEELDFDLGRFVTEDMKISTPRVILYTLKRPRIIPQLLRLAANSAKAGKSLADGLQLILPGIRF